MHLPLVQFGHEALTLARLTDTVDAARDAGFAAVSANDHFLFSAPWLDGPSALAAVVERTGDMTLATTVALSVLRGPVGLAKTLAALDVMSEGRLVAGLGPGSSQADYDAVGIPFDERWARFDESIVALRALLGGPAPERPLRFYPVPDEIRPAPGPWRGRSVPLWIGSWGSQAGIRRVARLADGWLASAYNTTPERFAQALALLVRELGARDRRAEGFPNALASMWTWVTDDAAERGRVLETVLAPLLKRDPEVLRDQICVGPPEHCASLLRAFAEAGCERVFLWPLGDERRQVELVADRVVPLIGA